MACVSPGEDWPTHLHDYRRSGWTSETLAVPLSNSWTFISPHAPDTAWEAPIPGVVEGNEEEHRVDYDNAFQVAVSGGRAYFGSSSDDQLYCLDVASGKILWIFFTEGPVRLAPTIAQGRVYFGSDDGVLYCLDAASGEPVWSVRLGPDDRRQLGNGRMISRWPVRTDVIVKDGVVYCGAGVFPHEGVVLAAFEAETGTPVWRNDTLGAMDANRSRFSPQGYLLAEGDMLYSPSGRDLPAAFSIADGSIKFQSNASWRADGIVGGTYATLVDDHLLSGANQNVAFDSTTGRPGYGWFTGRRTVPDGAVSYMITSKTVEAIRRDQYAEGTRELRKLRERHDGKPNDDPDAIYKAAVTSLRAEKAKDESRRDAAKIERLEKTAAESKAQIDAFVKEEKAFEREFLAKSTIWKTGLAAPGALIGTPNALYAGGDGFVAALDPATGKLLWKGEVEGRAAGLAAADGHLLVSTDTGRVCCFRPGTMAGAPAEIRADRPGGNPFPASEDSQSIRQAAREILRATGLRRGWCLIAGLKNGELAYELAKNSEMNIVAIDGDRRRVESVRRTLAGTGLYGSRVSVIQADPMGLPVSNLFANLVVSESGLGGGSIPARPADLRRTIRPLGGKVMVAKGKDNAGAGFLQALDLGPVKAVANSGWVFVERGPLPGAGNWTSQYANEGNTSSDDETRLKAPLGVLWYGDPGPTEMINRHSQGSPPVSMDGRMFIVGREVLLAYDAYNGTKLWEQSYAGGPRLGTRAIPGAVVAAKDGVFLAAGAECIQFDPATGEVIHRFPIPESLQDRRTRWSYLGRHCDLLVGSVTDGLTGRYSKAVFGYDVKSRKLLWTREGNHIAPLCIAMGDGQVFLVDSKMTDLQRERAMAEQRSKLAGLTGEERTRAEAKLKAADLNLAVALDGTTGAELWARALDLTGCTGIHSSHGELMMMYQDGKLVLAGASGNGHYWQQFIDGEFKHRKVTVVDAGTGEEIWAKECNYRIRPIVIGEEIIAEPWAYDLYTGRQKTRPHPITGEQTPWEFIRSGHHCGHVSATENLMFFRSKSTAYYDLAEDNGVSHFAGMRTGCTVNMIPANGLVLIPEASAGCQCLFAIQSTVTMEPVEAEQDRGWGIFTGPGSVMPVRHLRVNFGAPGDRRDASDNLWLAWPRPEWSGNMASLEFPLDLEVEGLGLKTRFVPPETVEAGGTELPWVASSAYESIGQIGVPVLGPDHTPGIYTLRLHFADPESTGGKSRKFTIALQDEMVEKGLEVGREPMVREFTGVHIFDWLEIRLEPDPDSGLPPSLSGLELLRTGDSTRPRPVSFRNPPEWPAGKPEIVLKAVADSGVSIKDPDRNEGAGNAIGVDGGGESMGDDAYGIVFLKFDLGEVPGKPIGIKLRLQCLGPGSIDAGKAYAVTEPWEENAVTWNRQPKRGRRIGVIGAVGEKEKIERRLALVDPEAKELSVALVPTSTDGIRYSSREGEAPPELVVVYEPVR